jgi:hypothetical protein
MRSCPSCPIEGGSSNPNPISSTYSNRKTPFFPYLGVALEYIFWCVPKQKLLEMSIMAAANKARADPIA